MSSPIVFSGVTYSLAAQAERNWAVTMNSFFQGLAANALPRSGGSFTLAADLDLGATANLYVKGLISKTAGPATTGYVRLANNEGLGWRNAAGTGDLILKANASNVLEYNGVALGTATDLSTKLNKTGDTATNLTLVTPALGTPASGNMSNVTNIPLGTDASLTGTLSLAKGGTGQTTANAAFNALAPSQTSQTGKFLQTDGTNTSWVASSGGLAPVATTSNVALAVVNTMYSCTSTGGFTITLPPVPTLGGVIGVMDAGETCSATNFIRVTPATGQSIDGYPVNDSILLDYARANAVFYAAPGATSWKVQYQATSMISNEDGTFTGSFTGAAAASVVITYSRVGKNINISLPTISIASTSTTGFSCPAGTIPASLRPLVNKTFNPAYYSVGGSGVNVFTIFINADGSIEFRKEAGGLFTSGTTYALPSTGFAYVAQ